ncbi:hypothetical protein EZV62_007316 [Acer yangbiense]|uniref:Uncharacterized protein n=1 Tax=Acer yangbiense TaxID=1000413 RepID=A0A5C7IAE3_9ROSI|nr:hypothetical protein EZV62_007316 [Acer yangbiense]
MGDASVMSWILNSVNPDIVLTLRSYDIAMDVWNYLKKVYHHDNSARMYQLEFEISNYMQRTKTIREYYSGFMQLWIEQTALVCATLKDSEIIMAHKLRSNSHRDQFLMKLHSEFEPIPANIMNRVPAPSLDTCLQELIRELKNIVFNHNHFSMNKNWFQGH